MLVDSAVLDGAHLERPAGRAAWRRHAVSELSGARRRHRRAPQRPDAARTGHRGQLTAPPTDGHEVWFTYADFATPTTVYRYDARTGELAVWARPPGAVPATGLDVRQVAYPSRDGTDVRMFVIAGADQPPGPRATILYGYGGFNNAQTPWYSTSIVTWVEARRRVRGGEPARRQRGRRAVAPGRHARAEAERLRRLHAAADT